MMKLIVARQLAGDRGGRPQLDRRQGHRLTGNEVLRVHKLGGEYE